MLQDLGRLLLLVGAVIVLLGLLLSFGARIPWLGRLPGDILIRRENFTFYFPIATSILVGIFLTLVFWLVGRR